MANETLIGKSPCPLCGEIAPVKLTKKKKAYMTCSEADGGCGYQGFARGIKAHQIMKEKAGYSNEGEAVKPDGGRVIPDPAEGLEAGPVATVTRHTSDGETETEEKTIFDILGKWANK